MKTVGCWIKAAVQRTRTTIKPMRQLIFTRYLENQPACTKIIE